MSVSPHELLEQGYTHFHKREFEDAFGVWSLVLDHPAATEDDRAAARECLELLDAESREQLPDMSATHDESRSMFDSAAPFQMLQQPLPSDEDPVPLRVITGASPPPASLPSPAVAASAAGKSSDDDIMRARLAEAEAQLRDARERMIQLEKMVNDANAQKREFEVKINQNEHLLASRQAELINLNQELAAVSREVLSKDRELKSRSEQNGGARSAPAPHAPPVHQAPPPMPSATHLAPDVTIASARAVPPPGAAPALFRSVDPSSRKPPPQPANGSARGNRPSSRNSPRTPPASATSGERMKLQTMLGLPTTGSGSSANPSPTAGDSSRAFNLQRMGAGSIMRTGLHPHSRPVNWLAIAASVGLMVSVLLPWRSGVGTPGDLMIGGLPGLSESTMPMLPTEIWRSVVELLYLLPVFGLIIIVWELVHWSLGYDGHALVGVLGLVAGLLALGVFGTCSPTGQDTIISNVQWHLPYVRSGFWFAIGSSALLLVAAIAWPRARVSRHGGYGRPLHRAHSDTTTAGLDADDPLLASSSSVAHDIRSHQHN
ncbi:MAG: coiled-coil domain-containing protein [Planctomycetota bacterium]